MSALIIIINVGDHYNFTLFIISNINYFVLMDKQIVSQLVSNLVVLIVNYLGYHFFLLFLFLFLLFHFIIILKLIGCFKNNLLSFMIFLIFKLCKFFNGKINFKFALILLSVH